MGVSNSLPLLSRRSFEIVLQYNIREKHLVQLYTLFLRMDTNCNGVWTIEECYNLISETRISVVEPFLNGLFDMADSSGVGQLSFEDFMVSFLCFCSLGKEEVLQFMFMVIDKDHKGYLTRQELITFFSRTVMTSGKAIPLFPQNNVLAVEDFCNKHGPELIFDQLAQISEVYPLTGFGPFHLQFLIRNAILGKSFWNKWDSDRDRIFHMEAETVKAAPEVVHIQQEYITVTKPGRFVFKEILEYGRRKSYCEKGKQVSRTEENVIETGSVTAMRDENISRTPILNIIRNPKFPYHVPYVHPKYKTSAESIKEVETYIETPRESENSMAEDSDDDD